MDEVGRAGAQAGAKPGLEVEPVDEVGRVGAQAAATTMVVAAISKDIRGRCTLGSSTSHLRRCHNSRTHGSTTTSHDFCNYNSRERTISSPTSGEAGEDHPTSSGEEERTTSIDHNIGEEISLTSSASCVSSAARKGISPQTA